MPDRRTVIKASLAAPALMAKSAAAATGPAGIKLKRPCKRQTKSCPI